MIGETFSHYKITKKLGEGGMGAVFLAEDTELRRNVALKFLPEYYTSKADLKTRFKREAQAAAALNHPAIITVYEVGEYKDSSYIAMEYVEGKSLRDIIDAKEFSFEKAIELVIQVADGLSFAHQHGIVHRDIKPENIMLDKYGRVKILDFGLAKYKGVTRITREGTTMGTPHYMSPEQVKGHELDQRSDIYSLGVVMYELLSGELPFQGHYEAAILYAIVNEEPTRISKHLPDIAPALEKVVAKTLRKEVKARYQSLEDFLTDLKKERQRPTKSYKPTVLLENYNAPKTKNKKPILIAAISSAAVLVIAFTLIFSGTFKSDGASSKPPEKSSETIARSAENPPPNNQPTNGNPAGIRDRQVDAKIVEPKPKTGELTQQPKTTPADAPIPGVLQITSTPSGANVLQNGRSVGKTPFDNKSIKAGSYDIIVRMDGYDDFTQRVRVTDGKTTTVSASLKKKAIVVSDRIEKKAADIPTLPTTGTVKILVKPFGSIFIDGKTKQQDSDRQYTEDVPTGKHTIRAIHPKFGAWQKEVTIVGGKSVELRIDFTKEVRVTVASKPVWGEIYVDNQPTGFQTTKEIALRVGQHTIEVRRDGYETVGGKRALNFEEDIRTPLVFELQKK